MQHSGYNADTVWNPYSLSLSIIVMERWIAMQSIFMKLLLFFTIIFGHMPAFGADQVPEFDGIYVEKQVGLITGLFQKNPFVKLAEKPIGNENAFFDRPVPIFDDYQVDSSAFRLRRDSD